jgi:predicted Rossmann fold nucleotide-binding protein DprA/Smf involved in DNA uptake
MVTDPREILEDLRARVTTDAGGASCRPWPGDEGMRVLEPKQRVILARLGDEPKDIDLLALETGLTTADLLAELMRLELRKAVTQLPGKTFIKAS